MKCAIFEEHSSSCVVYSRFSGTLFPVSMIDGDPPERLKSFIYIFIYTRFVILNLSKNQPLAKIMGT